MADIATNNGGEHGVTPRMKYIMIILDNWDITIVQYGLQNTGLSMEQEFCITRLELVEESTQSVLNFWRTLKTIWYIIKTILFWIKIVFKEKYV